MSKLELELSAAESEALLAALPLISYADFDTSPEQMEFNTMLSLSVAKKLVSRQGGLNSNELRVACIAVDLAVGLLSGTYTLDVPDLMSDLRKHHFTFYSLHKRTEKLLHRLLFRNGL